MTVVMRRPEVGAPGIDLALEQARGPHECNRPVVADDLTCVRAGGGRVPFVVGDLVLDIAALDPPGGVDLVEHGISSFEASGKVAVPLRPLIEPTIIGSLEPAPLAPDYAQPLSASAPTAITAMASVFIETASLCRTTRGT